MIKRLFFDIETSLNIVGVFRIGPKVPITIDNLIKEQAIICICYKWEGSSKVYSLNWDKNQCDKKMLKDFLKVANQADELVAHNGNNFDMKIIRGRCFYHEIPMFPKYVTVDTYLESRNGMKLVSHKLAYMSKLIGSQGKIDTNFKMWIDITLKNCRKTLSRMVTYCKRDVLELEAVYKRLAPYIKPKSSLADYKCQCPECNSTQIRIRKYYNTVTGASVQLSCGDCGRCFSLAKPSYDRAINQRRKDQILAKRKK